MTHKTQRGRAVFFCCRVYFAGEKGACAVPILSTSGVLTLHNIELKFSNRKTVSVEVTGEGRVVVRAPLGLPEKQIQRFLEEKAAWIDRHVQLAKQQNAPSVPPLTQQEIAALKKSAATDLGERVRQYSRLLGVTVGRIRVRCQKTRWGSCSAKKNVNFNCLLMLCPEEVRDYVVVHELCHLKEMNHSPRFWREVERLLPDYAARRKWLKKNGQTVLAPLWQKTEP